MRLSILKFVRKGLLISLLLAGGGNWLSFGQELSQIGSGVYNVQYRPEAASYRVFKSDHFRFIYQVGSEDMARRTAYALEKSRSGTDSLVGADLNDFHMPVVINNYNDRSNGFVHAFPFRQEIETPSRKSDALAARSSSWPALVAPHELVHAAHAEVRGGFGLGEGLRPFAPDAVRGINLLAPRGLVEGVAVYRESHFEPGAGRLNAPLFRMKMKAATLSDEPWSLTQMLEPPAYTQPFNRFYVGGAHAFEYLAERGDTVNTDFFRSTVALHNRFPLLGHGVWLSVVTGQFPYGLQNEMQTALREAYQKEAASRAPFTDVTLVAGESGLNHRRPYWLDEETLVAFIQGYDVRAGFYRIDAQTGHRAPIRIQELTEDRAYSLGRDTTTLLASRYVQDPYVSRQAIAEIERIDLGSGKATRLTERGRAFTPADGKSGRVYATTNDGPFSRWSIVTGDRTTKSLIRGGDRRFRQIAPSPRDSTIAVLVNQEGNQRLYRAETPVSDSIRLEPWFGLRNALIYDVSWGPEGRYLLFSADPGGTANIYAYDTRQKQVLQLANAKFGALEPALSPDRTTLAFVNYRHERHDLVRRPFRPDSATVVPDSIVVKGKWRSDRQIEEESENRFSSTGETESRAYAAWRHLAPRMVYPTFHGEGDEDPLPYFETPGDGPLGLGIGLEAQGADPLQRWAYKGTAYVQRGRFWGEAKLQSGKYLLRPELSVYDRAFTTCCVNDNAEVALEERGGGLGLRLPVTLESNVYQSLLRLRLDTEVRQTRLFGGPLEQSTPYVTRVTLNPRAALGYRLQQNPRDLVPNTGVVLGLRAEVDAWTERGPGGRYLLPRVDVYVPIFQASNTGLRVGARSLFQNREALFNTSTFLPRGHREGTRLEKGAFLQFETEITQPLWYIDDGLTIVPFYAKALSVYGFGETLGVLENGTWSRALSSVGAGLSLKTRLFYALNVDFRLGLAFTPETDEVNAVYR